MWVSGPSYFSGSTLAERMNKQVLHKNLEQYYVCAAVLADFRNEHETTG